MPAKRFSNQTPEQILRHLTRLLKDNYNYNLYVDPLEVGFMISESTSGTKKQDRKRPKDWDSLSKKQKRRKAAIKPRASSKIRGRKQGRTVNLKGVSY
ncbi:MAG: hypothetical protein ABIH11_00790 [Candidatus Altiarchaeota archaeon]